MDDHVNNIGVEAVLVHMNVSVFWSMAKSVPVLTIVVISLQQLK